MFKELGEFIDQFGRASGRMVREILSDKNDDDGVLMGVPDRSVDLDSMCKDLDSMCKDGLITEEQRDALKSMYIESTDQICIDRNDIDK